MAQRGGVTAQQRVPQGHVHNEESAIRRARRAAEFQLRDIRLIRSAERKNESVVLFSFDAQVSGESDPPQPLVDRQTENIGMDL